MKERAKEQDDIPLPWHPESEKPDLPLVICTNGEGRYWCGEYDFDIGKWAYFHPHSGKHTGGVCLDFTPLVWIEPEKFVPFVKKKPRHFCKSGQFFCREFESGILIIGSQEEERDSIYSNPCKLCPFCGFKAGE